MFSFVKQFKYFDAPLQVAVVLLGLSGLALLYATSLAGENTSVFWRQIIFFALGLAGFWFLSFFDYHSLAKTNRIIYVIILLALLYLLVFGLVVRGGKRWLPLGPVSLQPAEFAKFAVILGLARLLYLKRGQINSIKNLIWSFFYAAIPAFLVMLEPDFGSALIILGLWAGILLVSPIKKKILVALFLIFAVAAGIGWKFALKDFQKDRVKVFLNPALDPKGRGYNVRQAAIAIGSGQFLGRGFGRGLQSNNQFLPERQTDFIFAASGEQVGFLGSGFLVLLYGFLLMRILKIFRQAKDDLGMYISAGVFFLLFAHIAVNIGMNLGLLPVTGIPLPFLSAGGSSLLITLLCLGVVQNVAMQSKILRF